MSWFGYSSHEVEAARLKRENDRLQRELEEQRYQEQERREQEERQHEQARREAREAREEALRTVSGWPDAFQKGLFLIGREAREEARDNARYAADPDWKQDTWFQDWEREVRRAQALYAEELEAAEAQIQAVRAGMLAKVADRLETEFPAGHTAEALRDNNPDFLVNW